MSNIALDNGIAALQFARQATLGLLEDIPADKLAHQPCDAANHALWIVGHLAHADDFFMTALVKRPSKCSDDWKKLFGMGSTPQPEADAYPGLPELTESLSDRREELLGWFKAMTPQDFARPLPEDMAQFAANRGILMSSLAWHEGLHTGQLSVVRKSLGIAPKFG